MPEVSLVAILDADKEGFLRSDRSLIQTMGRAARNINGKAILYADKITGSMERAMDETRRRRERQAEHNEKHGIKPESIVKKVTDIMESAYPSPQTEKRMVGEDNIPYDVLSPEQLLKKAAKLEKKMLKAARDLEFEEAARLRDEIQRMRDFSLGVIDQKAS
jgi:excinuclease ABC subunit B